MPDYPDFHKIGISWTRRDWASREAEIKSWAFERTADLPAGSWAYATVYTVPSGRRLYLTDAGFGGEYKGVFMYDVQDGPDLFNFILSAYNTGVISFSTPPIINAGETLRCYSENLDSVDGKWHGFFLGFETPASVPEKPKNDDPEELYRTGEFNWAKIYQFEGDENLIIFGKYKQDIANYLRVRYLGPKKKQKIASFKIGRDKVVEIRSVLKEKPELVKKALEDIEKKLKPRRWFRIK